MRFPGFIGPTYTLRSVNVDCQRCVNLYPEMNELGTGEEQEKYSLVGTPGLSLLANLSIGPTRGMLFTASGRLFVVSYNKLYEISSTWTKTDRGTLSTFSGRVGMAENGLDLVIVDGPNGYTFTLGTNTFGSVSGFLGADQVVYADTFFIFNQPATQQFYCTSPNSTVVNPASTKSAEGAPDLITGLINHHRDIWFLGAKSAEIWFNAGDDNDNPFERMQGGFIETGCPARWTIAKGNDSIYWLGVDEGGGPIVFKAQAYQPQRISTHAIEYAIRGYGDISDATAFCYGEDGHLFYSLSFPSASATWVFDAATNLWHERAYTSAGVLKRHRAEVHAYAFGVHVVGDYENGNIYALTQDVFSDDGAAITRLRASPHVTGGLKRLIYSSLQLDIESGTGLDGIAQGTDPQIMLQWSNDGGHTWSNEHWTSFGKIGQLERRAIWRRLGLARSRVFRVKITDPVKVIILGAEITIEQGAS